MATFIASAWIAFLLRPLGGVGLSLLRGRMHEAAYYFMTWRGRVAGALAPEARAPAMLAPLTEAA